MRSRTLVLLLALLAPGAVQAQGISALKATAARLQRELDSLKHLPKPVAPMDTLRLSGGWVVATSPAVRALVKAEAPVALADISARLGGALTPDATPIRIEFDSTDRNAAFHVTVGQGSATVARDVRHGRAWILRSAIRGAYADAAWLAVDPALRSWAEMSVFNWPFDEVVYAARVRFQRDTGSDPQECRVGAIDACVRAFGASGTGRPEFSSIVRLSLLRFALERAGGIATFPRLYEHPERPILTRIAALSGMPVDTLVARWRQALVRHDTLDASGAALAVIGSLLLLAIGIKGVQWRGV